jgi:fibronectin-binding autotransporter adhesin
MTTSKLFKLGAALLILTLTLGVVAFAQQRTWYVNNQIGSDGYDGLSATVTPPSSGPKRTISSAIAESNDGDIIVVASTGIAYSTSTGEAALNPGNKKLTFSSTSGTPTVSVLFTLNNTAVATTNTTALTFTGPFAFSGGFTLQRGGVVGAGNLTLSGTITRHAYTGTDPAFDALVSYPTTGAVHVTYQAAGASEITTGNEFRATGVSNLTATGSAIAVTLNGGKTISGNLVTQNGSTVDLGGFTLVVSGNSVAHAVNGNITNGTLDFQISDGDVTVTGTGNPTMPTINVATSGTTTRTFTLTGASTTRALTFSGNTTGVITLTGGTSASAPSINGSVTNNGTGTVTIDRSAAAVLFVTGDLNLMGSGAFAFGANMTGLTLTGNVLLSYTATLTTTAAQSNLATITFKDVNTTITGSVTNAVTISGASDDAGNSNIGRVIFLDDGMATATVNVGAIALNATVTATFTVGGDLATSGLVILAATGAADNTYVLGDLSNSSTLGASAAVLATVGRVYFESPLATTLTVGNVSNTSTYGSSTVPPAGQGDIDFTVVTGAVNAASFISGALGRGGDILVGNGALSVSGNIQNSRTHNSAVIAFGTGAATISGNVVSDGSSVTTFGATGNTVTITGALQVSSGTVTFSNTTGPISVGTMNVSGGTVNVSARTTGSLSSTTTMLTGGTIALGGGANVWNLAGTSHTIGGSTANPTFTGGVTTTLTLPLPVPTNLQVVTFGPLEPSYPGPLSVTNNGGLAEAVKFTGGNFRVAGNVAFNTGNVSSKVVLDGGRIYVGGTSSFTNTTGYLTMNNGFMSMSGTGNQNVGGAGDFWDFEVNTGSNSAVAQVGIGAFKGVIYLTSGTFDNLTNSNITLNNSTTSPTIVRNAGGFLQAPTIAATTKINVTYIGNDKASSFELPAAVDKLQNLTVATTNGGAGAGTNVFGKGTAARGVVTVISTPTVNGVLTVNEFQTLAIGNANSLKMNGPTMQVDGQIVNLVLADYTTPAVPVNVLYLVSATGTTISGSGLLPPVFVEAGSSGNVISGPTGIVDMQLGANYIVEPVGGNDVIDSTPAVANGSLRFASGTAGVTLTMGAGAGASGTHLGAIVTSAAGNSMALGANLTASGDLTHAGGTINIGSYILNIRGTTANTLAGTASITGSGTLRFTQTAASSLALTSAATIATNVDVTSSPVGSTFSVTTSHLTISGNLSLNGQATLDIASAITLTATGASVTMGASTAFTATGGADAILRLNAAAPPQTFSFAGSPITVQNLSVSNDVVLAGAGSGVTINGKFTHDGGVLDFSTRNITVSATGTYARTAGSYSATTGYFIFNGVGATFGQGATDVTIPNLRFAGAAAATVAASPAGMVTVSQALDLNMTADVTITTNGRLVVSDGATVTYDRGSLSVAPTYGGTITLIAAISGAAPTARAIPATVWPDNASLVTTFRVSNAFATNRVYLPAGAAAIRTVNTTLDLRTGVLDLSSGNGLARTLNVADNATVRRRQTASVTLDFGSTGTQVGTISHGMNTNMVYEPSAAVAFNSGPELSSTLNDLTFTRSGTATTAPINSDVTITKSITVNGTLTIRNDMTMLAPNVLTIMGNVVVALDAAYNNATPPAFPGMTGTIRFAGGANQEIMVPAVGAVIGPITIDKDLNSGTVTITGGDLATGTVTFIRGLLVTGNNVVTLPPGAGVLQGFDRTQVTGGNISHIVGNVRKEVKAGRNEFPVGTETFYRPAALTSIVFGGGLTITVRHVNTQPTGIVGLPIIGGIVTSTGATHDIARYPGFHWEIFSNVSIGQSQFHLELTATGYLEAEFGDIALVRIIRRIGTATDVTNTWSLQGTPTQYDNFVVSGVPTVVNVNSTGGIRPERSIFTYGLKSNLFVQNPIPNQTLTDANPVYKRKLTSPPVFAGNTGELTFSATSSNTAIATAEIKDGDSLIVTLKTSGSVTVTVTAQDVDAGRISTSFTTNVVSAIVEEGITPTEFALEQNFPNPFNPSTTIRFALPQEAPVSLVIYNMLGVPVRTLINGERLTAAFHQYVWDGKDESGITVPSGVYLYRIAAGSFTASKRMTLVK